MNSGGISTGLSDDPKGAANYVRIIVARLRKILGNEAIITERKHIPRLNLEIIRVDLIEAMQALKNCQNHIAFLQPRKALKEIEYTLRVVGHEPLYPTLYGSYFEVARLDFFQKLSQAVINVAQLLRRESDLESATKLLRQAYAQIPNTKMIARELIEILELTGRNVEALHIKKQLVRTTSTHSRMAS